MSRAKNLVLVHGFLGTNAHFDPLLERLVGAIGPLASSRIGVIRVGLSGHVSERPLGARLSEFLRSEEQPSSPTRSFEEEVQRVASLIPDNATIIGYSLGARVLLGVLAERLAAPKNAILIGVENGLVGDERAARATSDDELASKLRSGSLPAFVAEWERLPLFASQERLSQVIRDRHHARRLRHDASGAADALSLFSKGRMPHYDLSAINTSTLLLAGALDTKFVAAHEGMATSMPRAHAETVAGVGHDVALEAPDALVPFVERALA